MAGGFSRIAPLVARAADGKKAEGVLLLDVRRLSGITDYMLLATVTSPAHLEAVETAVSEVLGSAGVEVLHRDGGSSKLWRVLDFGGIMVHLMSEEARGFYSLDKLYHDAPLRAWRSTDDTRRARARRRK